MAVTGPAQECSEHVGHSIGNRNFHDKFHEQLSETFKHMKTLAILRGNASSSVDVARDGAAAGSIKESDADESETNST